MDANAMRETLRLWASGVSVVTTAHEGRRAGMTVSAFNSLSLDPPQILVCLSKDASTAQVIQQSGIFAVNILGADQAEISNRFAGRVPLATPEDRFDGLETSTHVTGAPVLADAIGWLDCRISEVHDGHSHWIVVGSVQATGKGSSSAPLLYFDRAYRALAEVTGT
ncbi:MAG: flavin reductase family protein [Pleurocapsa minor GSE-CHR-MK-17-07R]|jgi:flavin reductase (DIM6/NTAB) family NADH-FMN oxidoreductase RutF|nr:flavin reductase family protein [Pleurocapsa minor GSE-CHR-MK 17-07R]